MKFLDNSLSLSLNTTCNTPQFSAYANPNNMVCCTFTVNFHTIAFTGKNDHAHLFQEYKDVKSVARVLLRSGKVVPLIGQGSLPSSLQECCSQVQVGASYLTTLRN